MAYKAIVVGASGLIGSSLLTMLLNHAEYDEVLVLVRKELPLQHKKLVQLVVDFDNLDKHSDAITGHALFCCLGTTKSKTPDAARYRKIDHDYPLQLAQFAKKNGVKHCHLVSAIGANKTSSTFYLKLKGELEEDLQKVGLQTLHIYQPSMLYGDRKEQRSLETVFVGIFKVINPLLLGGWRKFRSIPADSVAHAMYKNSLNGESGIFIHTYDNIIHT
ncbi:nucleoside-diphosphate sugar epimerase [Mucilaginibacter sp. PAMC 26640]|nr:nucleoside-diphosphate sugar epimerase [Mucilaginibacter sp. PAMC 26640]